MLLRRIDSPLVARVGMPHDRGGWIVPEAALQASRGFVGSVCNHRQSRVLRESDPDATSVVEAHPRWHFDPRLTSAAQGSCDVRTNIA